MGLTIPQLRQFFNCKLKQCSECEKEFALSVAERFGRKCRNTEYREGQGQGKEEGLAGVRWRNGGGGAFPTE